MTKGFKIEDISFSSSGKETKNIKELTIAEDNFWQISGDKEEWSVTFLPVATKNITLSFRQSSYSVIEVAKINNRKADRKRYGIGIKELKLRQKQFSSNGVMGSLELPCQAGLYVAQPVVNAFPRNPSIWTMGLDSSVDSGVAWFNHGDVVNGTGKLLYLEGNGGTLTWRTSVSRLDNSFATLSSLISEPFKIKNIDSVLKSVSRFQSPAIFALKSKPQDGQVFVFQAQVGKRGDKFSPIFLGTGTGSKMAFNLPFSVLEYNIDPDDVKILVNKTEYSFNPDIGSLGLEEWSFSADHRQVVFSDDLPDRCKVEMYLEEERMLLEETSDGYIYKTNMLFDPDKDTIRISSFDRDSNRVMKVMPRDKKVINLGARNVEDDSFKLTSFNGTTYNGVSSRSLLASPGDYYLDAINGVLYLHTAFGDDETRVSFLHQRLHQLSKDDYEILYREARPIGVLIKDTIRSRDITENVKGNLQKRYVPGRISLYGVREDAFSVSTKVMTLSYDYVIKGSVVVSDDLIDGETSPEEVEYVDGKTEFLRLTPVTREETVAIEANGSGLVTFNLSAGALYYEGFMCEFSDSTVFVNRLGVAPTGGSSVGDYYVSPSGVVTIKIGIGQTLPAGIKIFYYFLNPDFTPDNKYSIDYKNGILHAYNELNTDATITYKASNYTMKYNICQEVDSFSYSPLTNTVTIKTENLSLINSLVKVIWEIPSNETPVAELRKYFSPIIDLIGYRFA